MAAPNIVNVSTITAKTVAATLTTTANTDILANGSSSGKVFKVNSIMVSNIDGTNTANCIVSFYDGSNRHNIIKNVDVLPETVLVVTDKNTVIYLEEGAQIEAHASAASDLSILISYEEIS